MGNKKSKNSDQSLQSYLNFLISKKRGRVSSIFKKNSIESNCNCFFDCHNCSFKSVNILYYKKKNIF